jgi:hypothetical protein
MEESAMTNNDSPIDNTPMTNGECYYCEGTGILDSSGFGDFDACECLYPASPEPVAVEEWSTRATQPLTDEQRGEMVEGMAREIFRDCIYDNPDLHPMPEGFALDSAKAALSYIEQRFHFIRKD